MKKICVFLLCFSVLHSVIAENNAGELKEEAVEKPVKKPELRFEDAGRLAVASSLEIKNLRSQRALREGAWRLMLRAFFPQVSFAVSEDERLSLISSDSFTKTYSINLEQMVFDGGRTATVRKVERAELILLSDELKRSEGAVIETALVLYRKILSSGMIIQIREKAMISLMEQRRILAEELALGFVIPLDLTQAEITVREAELELEIMKIQKAEQESQFAEYLGLEDVYELSEQIDIYRTTFVPDAKMIYRAALSRNPDLKRMVHSVMQRETEAKLASRSWIPTVKAMGTYSVSGQHYPLNRQSWTVGLTVNISSPWMSASAGGNAGWELPYDKTARVQSSISPLPDPASGLGAKQAALALAMERENYQHTLNKLERDAVLLVNNLRLSEQRRCVALETLKLGEEKYRLSEVLLSLGRITRVELMEERLEYEKKEAAAVEAAIAVLEAERAIEKFTDLPPGSLGQFFWSNK